jgi:formylglycine-generating enzyme required for sulfatase activity
MEVPVKRKRTGMLLLLLVQLAAVPAVTGEAEEAAETVLIPGGELLMGADVEDDHRPVHAVQVSSFVLDRHEVTNAQYARFCAETERDLPQFWGLDRFSSGEVFPHHPVVGVTWHDAQAYCEWRGMRLPTEAEWEYAARGGLPGRKFPWGDEITPEKARYNPSDGPLPVKTFEANGYGLYDMAGNVGEWVADWYDPGYYADSPEHDPRGPEKGKYKAVRGGGWHAGPYCNRVYRRLGLLAYWKDINVGFRCAADAPSGPDPG